MRLKKQSTDILQNNGLILVLKQNSSGIGKAARNAGSDQKPEDMK